MGGHARKTGGSAPPQDQWEVVILERQKVIFTWDEYMRNQLLPISESDLLDHGSEFFRK
ncbi:hypothetical protein ACPOL_2649 [Acidisarcina polymorpha]|uniref:Uncharacterized protein n=1 Tax=Acidisarcina polymorpha TaxID=2211140 RepID=A0A2Z5FYS6_9BACT|nr:hypothetical protein [Acidisarcina polymorpha]AXC11962.1 hypothetical protein ACPOL_2649 [Acidisarcina polymorpha]